MTGFVANTTTFVQKSIEIVINITEFSLKNKSRFKCDHYDYNDDRFNGMAFMTGLPVSCFIDE